MSDEQHRSLLSDRVILRRLLGYTRPHLRPLAMALFLMPVATVLDLAQPYLIKLAVDQGLRAKAAARLDTYALLFALCLLGGYGATYLQTYLLQVAGQRATHDLRNAAYRHLLRLRISFFDREPVGKLLTRVTADVDTLNEIFASGLISLVADALTLLGIIAVLLYLNWQLALLCLASAPLLALSAEVFRRLMRAAFRDSRQQLAEINGFLNEHVQGMAVVQQLGREAPAQARFSALNAAYRESTYRAATFDACLFAWVEALSSYVVAILLWFAAGRIATGALSFGALVAFYKYVDRFFIPIRDLSTKYAVVQSAFAAAERLFGLLDTDEALPEAAPPLPAPAAVATSRPAPYQEIRFEGVGFQYPGVDEPAGGRAALVDISFALPRGKKIAVVGHTGSGKSTLARLLLRQYDPTSGRVSADGRDVRLEPLARHRSRFALVLQDVHLFSGTVADNIALWDPAITEERIRAAARAVQAEPMILARGGYGARVHERGSNFSQGERQLLAFARALAQGPEGPEVLVLDEATASVDSGTEARIQAALEVLLSGRTALIIAHRLSTVRSCDQILVLHRGRLVERGAHDELLRQHPDGVYARLVSLLPDPNPDSPPSAGAGPR